MSIIKTDNMFVVLLVVGAFTYPASPKLIKNHIDWKGSHAETMLYAIKKASQPKVLDDSDFNDTMAELGLFYTSPCIYIDNCHVYTHTYHLANGSCLFNNNTCVPAIKSYKEVLHAKLDELKDVDWYVEIWERHRFKRGLKFNDEVYSSQWHLHANSTRYNSTTLLKGEGHHLNVTGVWALGVTGHNVTVSVVDDGLEWDNPDIKDNYNPAGSIDLNDHDNDPMPNENTSGFDHNEHGTRCAGEIAAVANNGICGVGVAYNAKVSGVRALDGSMTDLLERDAFAAKHSVNDIYSCSWGPEDDGKTVDGPHTLAKASLRNGILKGRNGYGSIYVVASGNGGTSRDNCNFDGYANSIFFVTIGAIDRNGKMPPYAELCASMLAVTPSSHGRYYGIVTTDITHRKGKTGGCTFKHSGTSAAAPLGAGVIALALSVNPCLTWRDVQHLVVLSSVKVDKDDKDWIVNQAGLSHSHKHGFGLMSAWNIVNAAKIWRQMPRMVSYTKQGAATWQEIRSGVNRFSYNVGSQYLVEHGLNILEYVEVTITLDHKKRGKLVIDLICPNREHRSNLATLRPKDESTKGFQSWTFSTVRCWGERASGNYDLIITDKSNANPGISNGRLEDWTLTLHGSSLNWDAYQQRIRDVKDAQSGAPLVNNISAVCDPPPVDIQENQMNLPVKVLQVIVILGSFLTLFAVLSFVEDFCTKSQALSTSDTTESSTSNGASVHYQVVNIPIDQSSELSSQARQNRASDQYLASNSDNEELNDDECRALLPSG